jgi:putative PIN family toxin of toxin-antitoxin system
VIRVVVDTNVLVSGTRNRIGNEARVIDAMQSGVLIPCLSEEIFQEYIEVLGRSKFTFPKEEVAVLLAMIRLAGDFFKPDALSLAVPDQSDAIFMACAAAAHADYLVTGNRRHLPGPLYGSARVVNARELLARITSEA